IMLLAFCRSLLSLAICSAFLAFVTAIIGSFSLFSYALEAASTALVSIETEGPIEDEMYAPLMYLPLATAGLARMMLEITAVALSTSLSGANEILPTGT